MNRNGRKISHHETKSLLFNAFRLAHLVCASAASGRSRSATARWLSQFHHCCGRQCPAGSTSGIGNTAVGNFSLFRVTTGSFNTAIGAGSLDLNLGDFNTASGAAALLFNTTGANNTATGTAALESNNTGNANTATGAFALFSNTSGEANTAIGTEALRANTTGSANIAIGDGALFSNSTGDNNTAIGTGALFFNTESGNTAIGRAALFSNTTGSGNTAIGISALSDNIDGGNNTAVGWNALSSILTGGDNTATGWNALRSLTAGGGNTAVGNYTIVNLTDGDNNTAVGNGALLNLKTGSGNIALGPGAGGDVTDASGVIAIGTDGQNVGNSCFIGRIYSNVQPIVGTDPDSVTITSTGRLGRGNVSSRRYKHDIQPMDKASEALHALAPVSFRYNKEYDPTQTLAFGLIAEEVAEVYPDLVGRDAEGRPESVRYEQINAMLLNEFLKEHRKVANLEALVVQQRKDFEAALADLKGQIQKVSAQVELKEPAPQVAENHQ